MEITLKDLLACDFFSKSILLAGEKGLMNRVTSVTVLDSPDAPKYMKGGELVVTTAYSLLNDEKMQKEVITNLAGNGAAGLGIKLRFFGGKLPETMIVQANKNGFPIFSICDEYAYTDIYAFISSSLISKQTKEIKRVEEVFKEINLGIHEEGLMGVAKVLNKWTGRQTIIILENKVYGYPFELANDSFPIVKAKWRLKPLFCEKFSGIAYYCQGNEDTYCEWLAMEIVVKGQPEGTILLMKGERNFENDDCLLLDYAASACTMEVQNIKSIVNVKRKYRKQFLQAFFAGQFSWEEATDQGGQLDFQIPPIGMVVVLNFPHKLKSQLETQVGNLEYLIAKFFGDHTIFGLVDGDLAAIFISNEQSALVEKLYHELTVLFKEDHPIIGLGRLASFEDIPKSFVEAKNAIRIGLYLKLSPKIYFFNRLGFYRLLKVDDEVEKYYEDYLKPLKKQSGEKELIETLISFIDSCYNYRDTAQKMYLHPNTIRYRITLIEKLCRVNFRSASDRLNMEIALKILPLINEEHKNIQIF